MSMTQTPVFPLSYRLRLALEQAGVTPDEMAAELGCHVNSVHNYVAGRREPKRSVRVVWAMRCGVPVEWFEEVVGGPNTGSVTGQYVALIAA